MTDRGDRAQAGKTKRRNAKARRNFEAKVERLAKERVRPFQVDLSSILDADEIGTFADRTRMMRLYPDYPRLLKAYLADDPTEFLDGQKPGERAFMAKELLEDCEAILARRRSRIDPSLVDAFEGMIGLWKDIYGDAEFVRKLSGGGRVPPRSDEGW